MPRRRHTAWSNTWLARTVSASAGSGSDAAAVPVLSAWQLHRPHPAGPLFVTQYNLSCTTVPAATLLKNYRQLHSTRL
jgi:hypothetical protein